MCRQQEKNSLGGRRVDHFKDMTDAILTHKSSMFKSHSSERFAATFDEFVKAIRSWCLLGKLLCSNRHPLPSLTLPRTAKGTQQMPFSYKPGNKTILLIEPIFKHHPPSNPRSTTSTPRLSVSLKILSTAARAMGFWPGL